jgi:hypothetical protein
MTTTRVGEALPVPVAEFVETAVGGAHRRDPIGPRTGGPAGNARLTAWLGIFLLVAFLVEGVTLLSLQALITVHLFVGAFLVPLALLKTATTVWRMVRYYAGSRTYRAAGPPPLLLRMLGPLVVLTALAVLGTGLALVALGRDGSYSPIATVAGFPVDALALHKAAFVLWLAVTAVHTVGRLVPAAQIAANRVAGRARVPGRAARGALLAGCLAAAVAVGVVVTPAGSAWGHGFGGGEDGYQGFAHSHDH